MAEKGKEAVPAQAPGKDSAAEKAAFRRQAALAILGAYVGRHGGFTDAEREPHMRMVWAYAETFAAMENAPPLPPVPLPPEPQPASRPAVRPVAPNDEWAVVDGSAVRRGFATQQEAEFYASARPGATFQQISGPGTPAIPTAV